MVRIKDDETQDITMNASVATRIVIADKTNPRYQEAVDYIKRNPEAQKEYLKTCTQMDRKPEIDFDGIEGASPAPESTSAPAPEAASAPTSAPQPEPMTAKQAYAILVSQGRSAPDYDNLVKILQGDSILFNKYQEKLSAEKSERDEFSLVRKIEALADTYETNKDRLERYSQEYKTNVFGKRTRGTRGSSDKSDKAISWQYLTDIVDVYATDEDGKPIVDNEGNHVVLSAEEKNEWMSFIFKKAKEKAFAELLMDEKYAKLPEEKAMALFRETTDEHLTEDLATSVAASAVKLPEDSETKVGSPKFFDYVGKQSDKIQAKLNEFISSLRGLDIDEEKEKIKDKTKEQVEKIKKIYAEKRETLLKKYKGRFGIDPTMVLIDTAQFAAIEEDRVAKAFYNAADDVEKRAKGIKSDKVKAKFAELKEKFTKTGNYVHNRIGDMEKGAEKVSKGRYNRDIKQMVKGFAKAAAEIIKEAPAKLGESFKVNKYQMGIDALASFALSASGYGATALGLYGGYMIARGWVAPVWTEARQMKINSKKEGQKPLGFFKRIQQASKKVTPTEKYNRKGWMTTALSAAVFVPLTVAAVASGGVLPVLGTAALMPVIKAGISVLVQGNETGHAYAAYRKNKEDENLKKAFKAERTGLVFGLLASAAGQGLAHSGIGEKIGEVAHDVVEKVKGVFHSEDVAVVPSVTTITDGTSHGSGNGFKPYGEYPWMKSQDLPNNGSDCILIVKGDEDINGSLSNGGHAGSASINEVYIDDNSLAPSTYSPDLGTSKGHWAWVDHFVGKERLQRQWLNLSKNNVMDHFGGRSKAETIYDINKLWSFGRKSFSVFGDKEGLYYINNLKEKVRIDDPELITKFRSMLASGVRPTIDSPYGADFLRSHFEALNLQGIDADKMDQLVSDTFKLTYEDQSVIREHIKELLPDADKSTLNKMTAIVVENRRFYENGKELEAARMLLDCGPEGKTYDYDGINKLLDRTQEILKTGDRPAQLETLKTDCPTDDDTVIHGIRKVIKTENKVVQTPVDPIDARTIPAELKSAPKLRAIVPPKSPAQLPNQEVTIGEVHRMTGDSRAAINGTGATVSEDATQTTSGQNHLKSNGYVYE